MTGTNDNQLVQPTHYAARRARHYVEEFAPFRMCLCLDGAAPNPKRPNPKWYESALRPNPKPPEFEVVRIFVTLPIRALRIRAVSDSGAVRIRTTSDSGASDLGLHRLDNGVLPSLAKRVRTWRHRDLRIGSIAHTDLRKHGCYRFETVWIFKDEEMAEYFCCVK
uniref:Uncharacterized protein n=1 Tax=Caenorhabditis japonica TaxID=281687 RepID=A0A8R1ICF2_CAEJA